MTQLDISSILPLGQELPTNLDCYRTHPRSQVATFKNIPIQFLKEVQTRLRKTCPKGYHIRYRFRGPRTVSGRYTDGFTLKSCANRFSVYYSPLVQPWH
jgi:hypothetical protein